MRSIWDLVGEWLGDNDERRVEFSHGGEGGRWYCLLSEPFNDSDHTTFDGVGNDQNEALAEAWAALTAQE